MPSLLKNQGFEALWQKSSPNPSSRYHPPCCADQRAACRDPVKVAPAAAASLPSAMGESDSSEVTYFLGLTQTAANEYFFNIFIGAE